MANPLIGYILIGVGEARGYVKVKIYRGVKTVKVVGVICIFLSMLWKGRDSYTLCMVG